METTRLNIRDIPAIVWGTPSGRVLLHVHGKQSRKEYAEPVAQIAAQKGMQTLSFDLPQHGERKDGRRCDVWNGVADLNVMADYTFSRWSDVSLFACSLGAYFSLNAFPDRPFRRCLFQSPILDMEYLVKQMMVWFRVSETRLQAEGEIDTPVDPLRWDYYQYILRHPVTRWDFPTEILRGGRDTLQSEAVTRRFAERFGCGLTILPECDHPFLEPGDGEKVQRWLQNVLPD